MQGTSFATPRAARLHAIATTVANAVLAVAATATGGDRGTPITTVGVVDWGDPVTPGPLAQLLARNPTAGLDLGGIVAVLDALTSSGVDVDIDCSRRRRAEVVRRWLRKACRPMDSPGHVVGAGFLDETLIRRFFAALDGADVAGLLAPQLDLDALDDDATLSQVSVAGRDMYRALDVYSQTGGLAYFDHDERSLLVW